MAGVEAALQAKGAKPSATASYVRQTEFANVAIARVREANPEAVVVVGPANTVAPLIKHAHAKGWKPLFVTVSFVGVDELIAEAGQDAEGTVVTEVVEEFRGRGIEKPSAVMFFDSGIALSSLPELGPRTRAAVGRLLPGGVTVLLDNPRGRYPLACGSDLSTLGLRVPIVPSLSGAHRAILQSSANFAGGPDARHRG